MLIATVLISRAAIPNKHKTVFQTISSTEMLIAPIEQDADPLSMPTRQVELEWPESIRIGEDETITLDFKQVSPDSISPDVVGYADVYSHYNLMAEARYDVAGVTVVPANPTRESMPAEQPVKFSWNVNSNQVGFYAGTVWLSLRFLPVDGGQANQVPIFIHEMNINVSDIFGLSESMAFLLGGLGVVLAGMIVSDDLVFLVRKSIRKITT